MEFGPIFCKVCPPQNRGHLQVPGTFTSPHFECLELSTPAGFAYTNGRNPKSWRFASDDFPDFNWGWFLRVPAVKCTKKASGAQIGGVFDGDVYPIVESQWFKQKCSEKKKKSLNLQSSWSSRSAELMIFIIPPSSKHTFRCYLPTKYPTIFVEDEDIYPPWN